MDETTRRTIIGRIDKAGNQLFAAREHLKFCQYSEAIQASQQCVELSVKSVFSFLDVHYSRGHEWSPEKKEFAAIAEQIKRRGLLEKLRDQHLHQTIRLPRLLFLLSLWGQFYITAKYGFETEYLASAQDLFDREEACLALRHAEECLQAATSIRFLDEAKLEVLTSEAFRSKQRIADPGKLASTKSSTAA